MQATAASLVDEGALWQRLRADGDEDARRQLLALHLPYARVVAAAYYAKRYHDEIEFADYLQYASLGLLEAMGRFDPQRGAQFRTFAARRMHGAILSGIERLTEKQQQIAARQRLKDDRVASARSVAESAAGAGPRTPEQLFRYVAEAGLGLALSWLLDGTGMVDDPGRSEDVPFYRSTELRQLRQRLLEIVERLPEQERTVVRSHYLQEMRFDEIAAMLHLTKGRISQIHKQALLRLRAGAGPLGLDMSL
jgi:RNA polymerase sigma factor for flagellar operon FliA